MASVYRTTGATSPSPAEPISPLPGLELNNSAVNPQPGVPVSDNRWISTDPTFTWPYPPSQYDPRCWVWAAGNRSFSSGQGPAFPTYPEIPPPWMMIPGYTDIPNIQPSSRSVEATRADIVVHKDMPTENQSEISHSDRRSDTQE